MVMEKDEISVRVRELIADILERKVEEITDEATFNNDLGADSLDIVEMIMAIEEEFALEIPDEKAEQIKTVKDAIAHIANELHKEDSPADL